MIVHKYNTGVSDTRNIGWDISTGSYVCFIDSDDYINGNMFEDLYSHTEVWKIKRNIMKQLKYMK